MFAPLPPFFVSRPSVVGALQRATEERLTEVVAPAGYGKSTLLSYWMRAHEAAPVTGLSLDRRDNDGRRLATRLVTALQHIHPGIGPLAIQNVDNSGESLGESFLSQLLGDIELAPSGVLVIDQAENITSPRVLDDLFTLIDLAPPTLRVVLATRNVPEHRWVREPEHQFRMADLAFRPDEAAVLLRRVSGRNLSRQQLDSVFQRTEGWPA
ncbi:MAG TPA: AAA family ATPase, partial [Microthrixaceae bacterium]|nr:AAA family ATPase [Microthrixaceae bacterium]